MDRLDIKILWELTQAQTILPARPGIGPSFREIAKKLGVSHGTIRNRIGRMYASGVIRGSTVYANPNLLGLLSGAYAIEVSPQISKAESVSKLASVEGVLFVQNFHGSLVGIAFVYEDESSRDEKISIFKEIAMSNDGIFSPVPYPPCPTSLSKTEAELALRLSKESSFSSYHQLAGELGISVRTLERSLARLIEERVILSIPTMDYRKISGGVPADLIVLFATRSDRQKPYQVIMDLLEHCVIYVGAWEGFVLYSLIVARVSDVTDYVKKLEEIDGVLKVRGEIVEEHLDQVGVLGTQMERWMVAKGLKVCSPKAPKIKGLPTLKNESKSRKSRI